MGTWQADQETYTFQNVPIWLDGACSSLADEEESSRSFGVISVDSNFGSPARYWMASHTIIFNRNQCN